MPFQPDPVPQALGLHKGDFMAVRDESFESFTIEITTAAPPTTAKAPLSRRHAALAKFAVGSAVEHVSSEQDLDDARYEQLRAKHLM